jgi:hypothetical protein
MAVNDVAFLTSVVTDQWTTLDTLTFCGEEYYPIFNKEGCDGPCLTLYRASGGSGLISFTCVRSCCGPNYVDFAIGDPNVCRGTEACGGPNANVGVIRVAWAHCEYTGAGWYCVLACGSTGDGAVAELSDVDASDSDIQIIAGPYDTEEEAAATCAPGLCNEFAFTLLPRRFEVTFTDTTGSCTCYEGVRIVLEFVLHLAGTSFYEATHLPGPCGSGQIVTARLEVTCLDASTFGAYLDILGLSPGSTGALLTQGSTTLLATTPHPWTLDMGTMTESSPGPTYFVCNGTGSGSVRAMITEG